MLSLLLKSERKKDMKKFLALLLVFALAVSYVPSGYAATGDTNFTNVVASGNVYFQSNLLANGREDGGALVMQSSSTPIGTTQLAYTVITKRVGGAGGLDNTDGGTRLDDGTPGQTLYLIVTYVETNGTWIVTPDTKTGFSTITFDAVGEHASLVYVDDTVGWIIAGSNATVA